MSDPIRLALLLCDTPIPAVQKLHGDYLAIFNKLLHSSLPPEASPERFVVDSFDVVHEQKYPNHDDVEYAGVLISGAGSSLS